LLSVTAPAAAPVTTIAADDASHVRRDMPCQQTMVFSNIPARPRKELLINIRNRILLSLGIRE
jgi:hypothetical protein